MLLLPVLRVVLAFPCKAPKPTAVRLFAETQYLIASLPKAALPLPVVFELREKRPAAELLLPVVFAFIPPAVKLKLPKVLDAKFK